MLDFVNSSMTILVADDEQPNRDILSTLLTDEGYRVVCAEDGQQALNLIRSQHIDLALLDVLMPGLTGFSVCRLVKCTDATRLIPVVLVTGLNSSDDRINGAMCGADDFLAKPADKYELLARVHSLLRLKLLTD